MIFEMSAFDAALMTVSLPQIKLFQKTKRGLELVSLPHFLYDF